MLEDLTSDIRHLCLQVAFHAGRAARDAEMRQALTLAGRYNIPYAPLHFEYLKALLTETEADLATVQDLAKGAFKSLSIKPKVALILPPSIVLLPGEAMHGMAHRSFKGTGYVAKSGTCVS